LAQSNGSNIKAIAKLGKECATGYNCSACLGGCFQKGGKPLKCKHKWSETQQDGREVERQCKRTIHRACFVEANGAEGKWRDFFDKDIPFVCAMCDACAGCGRSFGSVKSQVCGVCQHSFCDRCHDLPAGNKEFTCSACCAHVSAETSGHGGAATQADEDA
jgi:hypothetical protein